MTRALEKETYTPEEYLEFEIGSEERHEYLNGKIKLKPGGTPNHNYIVGNWLMALRFGLKDKPYETFVLNQRLWIGDRNTYIYPDIMVLPSPIQLQPGRDDTLINPCLIAEVLSKSTKDYDRSEKFLAYRTIEAFQEYLLIDQYQIHVEHYVKTAVNQWLLSEYTDPQVTLTLNSVDIKLEIADLYENIEFVEA